MNRTGLLRARQAALALAACLVLAGCGVLEPKLVAPTLSLTEVNFQGGNLQSARLQLTFHVDNPNDRGISVTGIEVHLDLSGMPFASGLADAAFTLPAHGSTDFLLDVTANLSQALAIAADTLLRRTVDYRVYGQVHLRHTMFVHVLNFDRSGQVRLH